MRRRILIAIVGVAATAVFLLALPLGIAVQRLYREDEVLKLERNATAASRDFDPSANPGDPVEFPRTPPGPTRSPPTHSPASGSAARAPHGRTRS